MRIDLDDCDIDSDWIHKDDMPDLSHAVDHMEGLLRIIYGEKPVSDLEFHLEEILSVLGMDLPNSRLRIGKNK